MPGAPYAAHAGPAAAQTLMAQAVLGGVMRPATPLALLVSMLLAGCPGFFGPDLPDGYIEDDDYTTWIIEIDHVSGMAPSQSALDLLEERMEGLVRKDEISVIVNENDLSGRDTWTRGQVSSLSSDRQDRSTGGSTVVTHVLYLDGEYEESNALGVAFGDHETVAIFKERIRGAANLVFPATQIERAVLVHEFGHVLGLVDFGTPMVNDHEGQPNHSDNRDSVMYHAVETTNIVNAFQGGIPNDFDAEDRRDICHAGGKGTC